MVWRKVFFLALLILGAHAPAVAAVEAVFYSREMTGDHYPHAFVTFSGTLDATGERIESSLGFTARSVTPAILFRSVAGEVRPEREGQLAVSMRQFALTLSDDRYRAMLAVAENWRNRPQPTYNLNRANCVHFVADLARAAGLRVEEAPGLMKRPRAFLVHVRALNPELGP